jgi:hypothetical protein
MVLPVDRTSQIAEHADLELLMSGTSYETAVDNDESCMATDAEENGDRGAAATIFENNEESDIQIEKLVEDRNMRLPREGENWLKCEPESVAISVAVLGEFFNVMPTILGAENESAAVL